MSLLKRVAAGLAIGAAALALPLAASPAYAADWHLAGGTDSEMMCLLEGYSFVFEEDNNHNYTEYKCVEHPAGGAWQVWVR